MRDDFQGIPWARISAFTLFVVALGAVGGFLKTGDVVVSLLAGLAAGIFAFGLIAFQAWRSERSGDEID